MKKGIIFIILFLLFISPASADELISAKLEKCVDGDTAYFKINNEKVKYRFLAINTPEKNEDYGDVASEVTCEMLTNAKKIEIEVDSKASKTDKYGRSLGWIYVDGVLLQKYLVENGYAHVAYIYGNYKYTEELCSLEKDAIDKKINIWSKKEEYDGYCNSYKKSKTNEKNIDNLDELDNFLKENYREVVCLLFTINIILVIKLYKKKKS